MAMLTLNSNCEKEVIHVSSLSCFLTLNDCLLDIVPALDCGLWSVRAATFTGLVPGCPAPSPLQPYCVLGDGAGGDLATLPAPFLLPLLRVLFSSMPFPLQSSESAEREEREGGKGKAKIDKVWDRRFRSSACISL